MTETNQPFEKKTMQEHMYKVKLSFFFDLT